MKISKFKLLVSGGVIFVLFLAFLGTNSAFAAPKKAVLGKCMRECVRTFNPSLADTNAQEFLISSLDEEDCVLGCKESFSYGECYYWEDGCCNPLYSGGDPDCAALPAGADCNSSFQCKYGLTCDKSEINLYGQCSIPPFNPVDYLQYRHYKLDPDFYSYKEFYQYRLGLFISDDLAEKELEIVLRGQNGYEYIATPQIPKYFNQNFYMVEYSPERGWGESIRRYYNLIQKKYRLTDNPPFEAGPYEVDIKEASTGGIIETRLIELYDLDPTVSDPVAPAPVDCVSITPGTDGSLSFEWDQYNDQLCQQTNLSIYDNSWNVILTVTLPCDLPKNIDGRAEIEIPIEILDEASIGLIDGDFIRWEINTRHYSSDGMNDARGIIYSNSLEWPIEYPVPEFCSE